MFSDDSIFQYGDVSVQVSSGRFRVMTRLIQRGMCWTGALCTVNFWEIKSRRMCSQLRLVCVCVCVCVCVLCVCVCVCVFSGVMIVGCVCVDQTILGSLVGARAR